MSKGKKIRNLVEQDNISVCLNDIVMHCVKMAPGLIDLEYGNMKTHLSLTKKEVAELEKTVSAFAKRIRGEVFEEVHTHAKIHNTNRKGNAEHFNKKRNQ